MRRIFPYACLSRLSALAIGFVMTAFTVVADSATSSEATQVASNGARERAMGTDAFSYLEDRDGARARTWVLAQNERTLRELQGDPRYRTYYQAALESEHMDGKADDAGLIARPGWMSMQEGWIYQVWDDARHSRGVWRRASLASFLAKKPQWQELLDMDALCAAEQQDWTFASASVSPNGQRALVQLSRGGSISGVWREFDLRTRAFVADGFSTPLSVSSNAAWRTDNEILVNANFGQGTINSGGNTLVVKKWTRGQPITKAVELFRGAPEDAYVGVSVFDTIYGATPTEAGSRVLHVIHEDARGRWSWWRIGRNDKMERLTLPPLGGVIFHNGQYVALLLEDWQIAGDRWQRGSVISIGQSDVATPTPKVTLVMQPEGDRSVQFISAIAPSGILLSGSALGNARMWLARRRDGSWQVDPVALPDHGTILQGANDSGSDTQLVRFESFLQPPSLYRIDVANNDVALFASAAPQFDSASLLTEQLEAKSADGMLVPYFVVRRRDLRFDGQSPTLVLGYGAGGGSQTPQYSGSLGRLWLEQGGVYVVASIRGGSERGPQWHVTGVGRQRTYEDMVAVTEDLIRRKITRPGKVGLVGYSAGGILGGVMLNQRPDLFGAAVLKAPLLDELRRDLMMGTAVEWDPEFGSLQDPEVRAFLNRNSPFQNIKPGASMTRPLLITSTTDETVPPAQARRYAAKLESFGMPFLFYETSDGGHGLAATSEGHARLHALIYTYLARQLLDTNTTKH